MKNLHFNLNEKVELLQLAAKGPYAADLMSAAEIRSIYNYRADKLTIGQVKNEIDRVREKIVIAQVTRDRSRSNGPDLLTKCVSEKNARYNEISRRKSFRSNNRVELDSALIACTYQKYGYGSYKYKDQIFKISDNTIAKITWGESSDWNYYAKSYGYAKNTVDNRRVEFHTYDFVKCEDDCKTIHLNNFAGNFLEKAIIEFFNVQKIHVEKELKAVQLTPHFSLKLIHNIGNIQIYQRYLGPVAWDFSVKSGENIYHDTKYSKLVSGLRRKIDAAKQAKIDQLLLDNTVLTAQTAHEKYGFCLPGMSSFAELNGLDIEGSYTIKELRNAVIQIEMKIVKDLVANYAQSE